MFSLIDLQHLELCAGPSFEFKLDFEKAQLSAADSRTSRTGNVLAS